MSIYIVAVYRNGQAVSEQRYGPLADAIEAGATLAEQMYVELGAHAEDVNGLPHLRADAKSWFANQLQECGTVRFKVPIDHNIITAAYIEVYQEERDG